MINLHNLNVYLNRIKSATMTLVAIFASFYTVSVFAMEEPSCTRATLVFPVAGTIVTEEIDLNNVELLSQTPFIDCIPKELDLPFILARVVTKDPNTPTYFIHYFDVRFLHEYLYNNPPKDNRYDIPTRNTLPTGTTHYNFTNPMNRLPIINEIHYFVNYGPGFDFKFEYLCSDYDLFIGASNDRSDYIRKVFLANDIYLLRYTFDRVQAQYDLGVAFYNGIPGIVESNYRKALAYFNNVEKQIKRPDLVAVAQRVLGIIYKKGGPGVAQDLPLAISYLQQAATQEAHLEVKAAAQQVLGMIYKTGGTGVAQDLPLAISYFKQAATQEANLEVKAVAQRVLGMIYKTGGTGVAQDLPLAIHYFKQAATQEAHLEVKAAAQGELQRIQAQQQQSQ